jgi:hypothetical protein
MPSHSAPDADRPADGSAPADPTPQAERVVRFAADGGIRFTVREELPADVVRGPAEAAPGENGRGCLVFESDVITYRVYSYPADWRTMPGERLVELALDSRPPEPATSGLAAPSVGAGGALEFTDYTGERWRVVEDACGRISDPTARTRRCLVFTTSLFVRRIYEYPADWARLTSEQLIALGGGA